MTHHNETHSTGTGKPKRVFVSRARILSDLQHGALLEQEQAFENSCQERGGCLELFYPGDSCEVVESMRLS